MYEPNEHVCNNGRSYFDKILFHALHKHKEIELGTCVQTSCNRIDPTNIEMVIILSNFVQLSGLSPCPLIEGNHIANVQISGPIPRKHIN